MYTHVMTCYFKNFACIDFGISHIATVCVIYPPLDPELVKHLFRILNYHLLVYTRSHVCMLHSSQARSLSAASVYSGVAILGVNKLVVILCICKY